ncbi:protein of unknown function [Pararobbsia alpina]
MERSLPMKIHHSTQLDSADASRANASNSASSDGTPSFQDLLSELNDFASGTPTQQMQDRILAQLGISPTQLKNMSPEDRAKLMQKVRHLMRREVNAQRQAQQAQIDLKQLHAQIGVQQAHQSASVTAANSQGAQNDSAKDPSTAHSVSIGEVL